MTGDEDAGGGDLAEVYDRLAPTLYRYALMILGDISAAEDAIQQVFASIAGRRGQSILSMKAYLRRAVRNECYSLIRRRATPPALSSDEALLEPAVEGVASDERLALEAALRMLPAEQREVVHLKVYEGLTFKEVAELTGVSVNTAASRYRYAMTAMRRSLSGTRESESR